jgi:pantothenate kinase
MADGLAPWLGFLRGARADKSTAATHGIVPSVDLCSLHILTTFRVLFDLTTLNPQHGMARLGSLQSPDVESLTPLLENLASLPSIVRAKRHPPSAAGTCIAPLT